MGNAGCISSTVQIMQQRSLIGSRAFTRSRSAGRVPMAAATSSSSIENDMSLRGLFVCLQMCMERPAAEQDTIKCSCHMHNKDGTTVWNENSTQVRFVYSRKVYHAKGLVHVWSHGSGNCECECMYAHFFWVDPCKHALPLSIYIYIYIYIYVYTHTHRTRTSHTSHTS